MKGDKQSLLLLYSNRVKEAKGILNSLNESLDNDVDYFNRNPDSINWAYLDDIFKLLCGLKKIKEMRD